jgi:hypothetical protein
MAQKVHGVVLLPEPCGLREANVAVQIIDASVMDIRAPILAETRFTGAMHGAREIAFVIDTPTHDLEGRDLRVVAEVLADPGGRVAAGDYLTMTSVQFEPHADRPLRIPVEKVRPQR